MREQLAEDRQFARRLELRAASAQGDLVEIRAQLHAYGEQALQAAHAIAALTPAGRAADVLGERGAVTMRRLATEAWRGNRTG
ncbi:hypothetical protein [Streptomyces sp. NPDC048172]|uniref:hypothetical protein n=1 Tax=Streptomyces sp. NPDC048172 TaxID=3365505 RepID=UPI00370F8C72